MLTLGYLFKMIRQFLSYEKDLAWSCMEIYHDVETLQRFVNRFPHLKEEMNSFSRRANYFYVSFYWSDEKPLPLEELKRPTDTHDLDAWEDYLAEQSYRDAMGDAIPPVFPHVQLYIDKTEGEIQTIHQ